MYADATPIAADKSREDLDEITGKVIGAAQRVHSRLGMGFLEKVYENAMVVELASEGCRVGQQNPVRVFYKNEAVGEFVTDLLVQESVVVEIKAVDFVGTADRAQCINYLRATGFRVCLLLNFGNRRLEYRRFVHRY